MPAFRAAVRSACTWAPTSAQCGSLTVASSQARMATSTVAVRPNLTGVKLFTRRLSNGAGAEPAPPLRPCAQGRHEDGQESVVPDLGQDQGRATRGQNLVGQFVGLGEGEGVGQFAFGLAMSVGAQVSAGVGPAVASSAGRRKSYRSPVAGGQAGARRVAGPGEVGHGRGVGGVDVISGGVAQAADAAVAEADVAPRGAERLGVGARQGDGNGGRGGTGVVGGQVRRARPPVIPN